MSATILNIKERNKDFGAACRLNDFTYSEGDSIAPETILDNPRVYLYCIDDASRRAIFTELPSPIDLSEVPFYHLTLFENAKQLIAVPYEMFHKLAANVPIRPENVILIHTTGRAGSTLLHKILNQLDSAVSLSEPDSFASCMYFRERDRSSDPELIELLRSCLALTFRPLARPGVTTFAFKLRLQAIEMVDLFYKAFPDGRHIFLYRNALDYVASFYRVFLKAGWAADRPKDETIKVYSSDMQADPDEIAAYLDQTRDHVAAVERQALMWILVMDRALKSCQPGIPLFALRYEDLDAKRPETLRALFEFCNLPADQVPIGLRAFEQDAQAGTFLARENPSEGNTLALTAEQSAQVRAVIARHPVIRTPDYILPGTVQV